MKIRKTAKLCAILSCLLVSACLMGCSNQDSTTLPESSSKPGSSQSQTTPQENDSVSTESQSPSTDSQKEPTGNITLDVYNEKINYYMELVEELEAEIVSLKEQHYIEETNYKSRITELETNVSELLDRIESILTSGAIKPVDPSDNLSSESGAGVDNMSKRSDFQYELKDGYAVITKYTGKDTEVDVPTQIDGYTVQAIGEEAFKSCYVKSVTLPDTVRLIDWFAFAGCTSLEKIVIPSSITAVEYGAFDYCPKSMTIHCQKGSYIEAYAKSWGILTIAE